VEGDVSGYYKSYGIDLTSTSNACAYFGGCSATVKITDYAFVGGPRINFKPIFIHALFGGDHLTGTAKATVSGVSASISESQDGAGGMAGGGVQWRVSGPWSVRASADYIFSRHRTFGGPSFTQDNYRAGVGIVYSFGRARRDAAPPQPNPVHVRAQTPSTPRTVAPSTSGSGVNIALLGVIVGVGRSTGAEINDVTPNSVASQAGLHVGDVINAVDGKPVKNPMELAAELAGHVAGDKVRLGFMIQGAWQSETNVQLASTR